ncbi:MAG: CBS domain-containing protein [Nitrososphaeria archaeon]
MVFYTLPPKDELIKQIKAFMRETGFSEQRLADETGLSQPVISRILMGERELRYEEAKKILDCLTSKLSSIPPNMRASDVATKGENLMKVHVEENLSDVAKMMFEKGYSQAPVYENEMIKGIITEKSFIELLLTPEKDLRKLRVKDAPIEDAPRYSPETPLQNIAKALLDYYSILIEENGRVKGIITRSDLLKLFFQ